MNPHPTNTPDPAAEKQALDRQKQKLIDWMAGKAEAATPDPSWLPDVRARAQAAVDDPFFVTDCEGDLSIWRESALTHVTRDDEGEITGWSTPASYKVTDHILRIDLETWDEGEDPLEDLRRTDIKDLVTARDHDVPRLLTLVDELTRRIAAAEALLPGITRHTPGGRAGLTIYQAPYGSTPRNRTYTSREAARAHCLSVAKAKGYDVFDAGVGWAPVHGTDGPEHLLLSAACQIPACCEHETPYAVTPLPLLSAYEPETEE